MYYQAGIVRSIQRHSPMAWIQTGHAGLLARAFRADKKLEEINDKGSFDAILEKGKVPRLEIIAEISADQMKDSAAVKTLISALDAEDDLFLKPVRGRGGQGAIRLVRHEDKWKGFRTSPACGKPDFTMTSSELAAQLARSSNHGSWLLQRRARNHPVIEKVFGEALACIRLVCGIKPDEVVFLGAVMGVGKMDSVVSQGGLTIDVDMETGRLGQAFHSSESQTFFDANPDNGLRISGLQLPDWQLLKKTAAMAHRQLPDYPFLGWDLALTPAGPLVVEANGNFGTGGMQKPGPRPLIDDRFLSVFNYWKNNTGAVA